MALSPRAIVSAAGKDHFLKALESIVESVKQSRVKIERRQQEEKSKRDTLNIRLAQLIDEARKYAKVLKDFQEVMSTDSFSSLLDQWPLPTFLGYPRKRTPDVDTQMN